MGVVDKVGHEKYMYQIPVSSFDKINNVKFMVEFHIRRDVSFWYISDDTLENSQFNQRPHIRKKYTVIPFIYHGQIFIHLKDPAINEAGVTSSETRVVYLYLHKMSSTFLFSE